VTFTNESTGEFDEVHWTFGDGFTSTLRHPAHTFMVPGAYTVSLSVSGIGGLDMVTRTNYVEVYTPVDAAFSAGPDSGTVPLDVAFTNESTGDYAESLWTFGDGLTSTLTSPTHTYTAPGTYTVTLWIGGLGGEDVWVCKACINGTPPMHKVYLPLVRRLQTTLSTIRPWLSNTGTGLAPCLLMQGHDSLKRTNGIEVVLP
jgi:PKD repeat protein